MEVNQLISLVKKKIEKNISTQNILIEDKTYLHASHLSHQPGRFHLKIIIKSIELKGYNKVEATKKIYFGYGNSDKKFIEKEQYREKCFRLLEIQNAQRVMEGMNLLAGDFK